VKCASQLVIAEGYNLFRAGGEKTRQDVNSN
jgi:hypothetical protein